MQAWEEFLQQQETELGQETVRKWLRSLKIQRFDACNLYLEAKDSFQALWFEEHMRNRVQTKFLNSNQKPIKIHLSVANAPLKSQKKLGKPKELKDPPSPLFHLIFDELNPHYLFKSFLVGEDNQLTIKLLYEIAGLSQQKIATLGTFNPIYLYGPTGSGKTHLMMSLAQIFRAQGLKTIYARAETFTDHVVSAIRAGEMSLFRETYRHIDVLLVDDVHIFSRKGATQEEFFHTFNTLHLQGKQIILTANCAPQELQLIEPRLTSRFEWGIVLPLKPLHTEDLRKMLKLKGESLQFNLPDKVLDFLLETFKSHPKSIVKAFEALVLRLHLDQNHSTQNLTVPSVKILLADLLNEEEKVALTPSKIIQIIADYYGIRKEDILGKSQTKECALPRQLAMHFCREKLKMPFMKIGDLFCRDHSTVMASVKYIQKSLEQESPDISGAWHIILNKLQNSESVS